MNIIANKQSVVFAELAFCHVLKVSLGVVSLSVVRLNVHCSRFLPHNAIDN